MDTFRRYGEHLLRSTFDTDRLVTVCVGIIMPLCVMVIILYWKIQQAEKKRWKQAKNKEKLIRFLKGEKKSLDGLEKSVKTIKLPVKHEKQE